MASTKPTIVLIPGAWHGPHTYHKLVPVLERRGYSTLSIRTPSVGTLLPPDVPAETLVQADATNVRAAIAPLLAEGKELVVVAHSYGGEVLSRAFADYAWNTEDSGRVLALVYMAAFVLPAGKSLMEMMGPDKKAPTEPDEDGMLSPPPPIVFYNDLPEAEQQELYTHLLPQSASLGTTAGVGEPWNTPLPAVYIQCEKDIILPQEFQKTMLEETGNKHHVVTLNSSHSPMLSMPEKVADVVELAEGLGRKAVGLWKEGGAAGGAEVSASGRTGEYNVGGVVRA